MTKADVIEKWLYSKVGCGYVYGATGWVCSMKRREQQASQYPEYEKTILTTCAKWDGKECYDCAQLVAQAGKQVGVKLPSGATSQWKSKLWEVSGVMADIPSGKLVCVFRESDGRMQHVGWRLRNGDVIDARGSESGVVLNKAYGKWTHWAMLAGINDEVEEVKTMQATVTASNGKTVNLRKSASTNARLVAVVPIGAVVDVVDNSGSVWWEVLYNGNGGFMMSQFLKPTVQADLPPSVSIEERVASLEARVKALEGGNG